MKFLDLPDTNKFKENEFSMLVTKSFAKRMKNSYDDPLLRQVLPDPKEEDTHTDFIKDPLNEFSTPDKNSPNILQKYQKRALLITSNACAINCRYCFRRHFPYKLHRPKNIEQAIFEIGMDNSISEIILSGGEPLLLDDGSLKTIFNQISSIKTVSYTHLTLPTKA